MNNNEPSDETTDTKTGADRKGKWPSARRHLSRLRLRRRGRRFATIATLLALTFSLAPSSVAFADSGAGQITYVDDLVPGQRFDGPGAEAWLDNYIFYTTGQRATPQVSFPLFSRRVDFQQGCVIYEAKAGRGGETNTRTRGEALNDINIILNGQTTGVCGGEWHFYPGMSGYVGPGKELAILLSSHGVNMVVHRAPDEPSKKKSWLSNWLGDPPLILS